MGTTVSYSSPEPEPDNPVQKAFMILNQKPIRMAQMLRLSRLFNDSTVEEKLDFIHEGVVHKMMDMIRRCSQIDIPSPPPARRNSAPDTSSNPVPGIGYGFGTTKSRWDLEKTVEQRLMLEEHLVWLLNALISFLYCASPDFSDPDEILFKAEQINEELVSEVSNALRNSAIVPLLEYHLRNESVFDISQHMELYQALLEVACSLTLYPVLLHSLNASNKQSSSSQSIIKKLVPKFRDTLRIYLDSPKGQITSPDFRLVDFIHKVEKWCEQLRVAGVGLESRPATSAAAVGENEEEESERVKRDNGYITSLSPYKVIQWKFIGDYGKLAVPFSFKKEAKSLNPFSPSLKERTKRIVKELASLQSSLPISSSNSIFVSVDEGRCDIMKVLIVGPDDTPYENGLFEFDLFFPSTYPFSPPKLSFLTTGGGTVRFNPNLYNDGKGLIFVKYPYFNEPGYERYMGTAKGNGLSFSYNVSIAHANLQYAVRDQIRNPPPHFKEVVQRHFWHKRQAVVEQANNLLNIVSKQTERGLDKKSKSEIELGISQLKSVERTVQQLQDELINLTPPS